MRNEIEEFATQILDIYASGNTSELNRYRVMMIAKILLSNSLDEFADMEHHYIVSKALFHVTSEMNKTVSAYPKCVVATFYCLLESIQKERQAINKAHKSDRDFAIVSALLFIFLSENRKFILEHIFSPMMKNDITKTLRINSSFLGTSYWNYKNASVVTFLEEDLCARFDTAIEIHSGIKGIADKTKVIMKQVMDDSMEMLMKNLHHIFSIC